MAFEILALGELLVDFLPVKRGSMSTPGEFLFTREAGGACANVAGACAKLLKPGQVAFVGRVGADPLGIYLKAVMDEFGVDTSGLTLSPSVQTPIAIVAQPLDSQEMEFSFYGPDNGRRLALIAPEDVPKDYIGMSRIVVGGGVSMSHPISFESLRTAASYTAASNAIFAFDPNWRTALWSDVSGWREAALSVLPSVDVLKTSRTELSLLTGQEDLVEGMDLIRQLAFSGRAGDNPLLVAVTMGGEGAAYALYTGQETLISGHVSPLPVDVVDPTGAGDAFLAGLISSLLDTAQGPLSLSSLSESSLFSVMSFANATGALTTTVHGGISGAPTRSSVEQLLREWSLHS